jgi:hypothetical protein
MDLREAGRKLFDDIRDDFYRALCIRSMTNS